MYFARYGKILRSLYNAHTPNIIDRSGHLPTQDPLLQTSQTTSGEAGLAWKDGSGLHTTNPDTMDSGWDHHDHAHGTSASYGDKKSLKTRILPLKVIWMLSWKKQLCPFGCHESIVVIVSLLYLSSCSQPRCPRQTRESAYRSGSSMAARETGLSERYHTL